MHVTYRTIIEPDEDGFHGYVPTLKGCHTWGKTVPEAKKNLQEAIGLYIESMVAHGEIIPLDVGFESVEMVEIPARRRRTSRQYA